MDEFVTNHACATSCYLGGMSRRSSIFVALPSRHALDTGMTPGHQVQILADPHLAWLQLLADIHAAQVSILAELYILVDDAAGRQLVDALIAAHGRGVDVRLVLDGVGSMDAAGGLPGQLTAAGVRWRVFHPVRPGTPWRHWTRRNHRKIVVVDEAIAHVSGRNIGADYYALTPGQATWRDLGARVEGPSVAPMAAVLRQGWRRVRRVEAPPKPPEAHCGTDRDRSMRAWPPEPASPA